MFSIRNRFVIAVVLVAVGYGAPAHPQTTEGRLSGVVRDASGTGVPGATVTITNQATGATHTATSAADGSYAIGLAPGVYSVAASLRGFGTQSQKDLKLAAGAPLTADFTLQTKREEEVTVTAMKREETVQNTPVSVAAPTEAQLRSRGVDDIEGVARNVAGFSVQNLGPGQSQVAMRGISSGQIARDQPGVKEQVGAYLDESVISLSLFTPDIDLFDMSRVEVLRGPQGTLFGSGSESGTVRYITNQPELGGKAKVFGEFGGNTIDGGDQGGSVKLGFNAPLGDKAALRVAAYYNRLGGYIDAVQPDFSVKKDVNTGDRTGVRAAIKIAPNDRLTITPRILYQEVGADGWNRIDAFNILANPYTTTRPPVTLGPREQFTQIGEPFKDKFTLGDLNVNYNFGEVALTSITSYTHRDVDVVRDAGALTSSITGGSIGLPQNVYTLDAPLDDATKAKVWTQELRLSGGKGRVHWVAGGFYANTTRDYGQTLLVSGFEDLTGIPTAGKFGAGKDVLFFSRLHYKLKQYAAFGEGTVSLTDQWSLTGGLRYYNFTEDRTQVFDGIFADPASKPGTIKANGVAPRLIASYKVSKTTNLNAQVSKGFRLGGINDQLNVPLCTPQDLATYSGLDSWKDEKTWNYEVGSKSRIMDNRGSFNVAAFYADISDLQATETAGSCSSRVILNVPKARSTGVEAELAAAPTSNFDFSISGSYNDAVLKSTFSSAAGDLGIRDGARLPSVPKFQMSAAATYQWQMGRSLGYATGTYQHVGSRFTQVGDEDLGTLDLLSFGKNTIGGPLTASTFTYTPELPGYDIVNLRLGVVHGKWDVALFGNNLTDERALLALDRERGTRARIGYLTNQPRSFGINARVMF
jgi:iron complex outermembrane recepter protein